MWLPKNCQQIYYKHASQHNRLTTKKNVMTAANVLLIYITLLHKQKSH